MEAHGVPSKWLMGYVAYPPIVVVHKEAPFQPRGAFISSQKWTLVTRQHYQSRLTIFLGIEGLY